ncbi:MAG: hypothetical protein ABI629_26300 [bacterium]
MTRLRRACLPVLLCLGLLAACGADDDHRAAATPTATAVPTATATPTINPLAQACVDAGGIVTSGSCCSSASDFPNTCGLGICGCSPSSSRQLRLCECPTGQCWSGSDCRAR